MLHPPRDLFGGGMRGGTVARFLAVAHQTSEAEEFVDALRAASSRDPGAEFVLLVPAPPVGHPGPGASVERELQRGRRCRAVAWSKPGSMSSMLVWAAHSRFRPSWTP